MRNISYVKNVFGFYGPVVAEVRQIIKVVIHFILHWLLEGSEVHIEDAAWRRWKSVINHLEWPLVVPRSDRPIYVHVLLRVIQLNYMLLCYRGLVGRRTHAWDHFALRH